MPETLEPQKKTVRFSKPDQRQMPSTDDELYKRDNFEKTTCGNAAGAVVRDAGINATTYVLKLKQMGLTGGNLIVATDLARNEYLLPYL
jgi:hypothetical protein